jgi:hypothetical protein
MAKKRPKLTSSGQGIFNTLADEIRLVIRLMADRRVNPILKLIPIGTIIYFFVPDLILGPIDDALILGAGVYLFIELCPPAIVEEHRLDLRNIVNSDGSQKEEHRIPIYEDEILEGEFRDE